MSILSNLWTVAAGVLLLNLPFGFWRAGVRRFSLPWVLAVHTPVPLVVVLRILSGLGWQLYTFPVMVGAFFTGQFLGGRLRGWWANRNWSGTGRLPPPVPGSHTGGGNNGRRC